MNPAIWLVIVALLFPGVPLRCKATCTMAVKRAKASTSSAPHCCEYAGHLSIGVQREVPAVSDSHTGCCTFRAPIPSGPAVERNATSSNPETRASNYSALLTAPWIYPTAAMMPSDVSPPVKIVLPIPSRTTSLRI